MKCATKYLRLKKYIENVVYSLYMLKRGHWSYCYEKIARNVDALRQKNILLTHCYSPIVRKIRQMSSLYINLSKNYL
jgi:hypothetical protein